MMALSVWIGYFVELLILFGIVLIHELGHAAAARMYGWKVTEIQLFPFGGVAVVEDGEATGSVQEIVVALAGPLQNAFMILISLLLEATGVWDKSWSDYFIRANMTIGLFNLLPVLPLDGGRIVQAVVSRYASYYRTLTVGVWYSLIISCGMAVYSIYLTPYEGIHLNLLAISCCLIAMNWFSLRNMYYRFIRFLMSREKRRLAIVSDGEHAQPIVAGAEYNVQQLVKKFKRERYHLVYVLDDEGSVKQVISEQRCIREFFMPRSEPSSNMLKYREMSGSAGE